MAGMTDITINRSIVDDLPVPCHLELFMAASYGDSNGLKELLSSSQALASEEAGDSAALAVTSDENSALHVVATGGDSDEYRDCAKVIHRKAKQLLVRGNRHGDTPLHHAARAGNTRMVSCLIELAAGDGVAKDMVRLQNNDGRTALHEAIGSDDTTMVHALMSADKELAQLNASDGTSPLFLAISLGHHSIARQLLECDKELSYSGNGGQNALHAAVLHNNRMARELLLVWTIENQEKRKKLIEQQDHYDSTPMHVAASAEDPSLEFYLFAFVDKSMQNSSFGLYYYIAPSKLLYKLYALTKHPMCILADAEPSLAFQPDKNGYFPVHVAASAGSLVPIIILLFRHPAACASTARLRDAQGRTFLHVAVEMNRLNVVKFVCNWSSEFKSMVNIQDNKGNTALHLAVHGGNWDICSTLIWNRYVALNLPNMKGKTPRDIAERKSPSASGFNFGMHARRRILGSLTFANAQNGNKRRDVCAMKKEKRFDEKVEDQKITSFAQIVGIGSVLVATASFTAAFTMPDPGNSYYYAFNGFVLSNTLAFICSALATFSLIYTGVAALDIEKRIELVSFSLALLIGAGRSFCAAFAFALYVELDPLNHRAAIVSCTMTIVALLDAVWFMRAISTDTTLALKRGWGKRQSIGWKSVGERLLRLAARFLANIIYLFWPYIVIFGLLETRKNITAHNKLG